MFEQDAKVGGYFVNLDYSFSAAHYDSIDGVVYYVSGVNGDIYEWDNLAQPSTTLEWKSKVLITKDMINLGAARVVADYASVSPTIWDEDLNTWGTEYDTWAIPDAITFRLWVDKELEYETIVYDSDPIRLPTGYRSDTYEVAVESSVRVRSIYLAETPLGLREV